MVYVLGAREVSSVYVQYWILERYPWYMFCMFEEYISMAYVLVVREVSMVYVLCVREVSMIFVLGAREVSNRIYEKIRLGGTGET